MSGVLQRDERFTVPRRQGELFILTKGKHRVVCELWTHQFGWELRVEGSRDIVQTQVCRSQDEVFDTFEAWKAALIEKGWR